MCIINLSQIPLISQIIIASGEGSQRKDLRHLRYLRDNNISACNTRSHRFRRLCEQKQRDILGEIKEIIYLCIKLITMKMTENQISYQIRGAIFDVYNELGPGLLESVYEEAMVFELNKRGLSIQRQLEVPILYKGERLSTDLRLDLLVEDAVIVELKSVSELQDVHYKQLLTYLKLTKKKLGILVNFNTDDIQYDIKRVANGI